MKIGILKPTPSISPTGGVRIQALMWRDGFNTLGHEGVLVNTWEEQDWKSYDAIIIMDFGGAFRLWMNGLSVINPNIACAPIIDPKIPKIPYKLLVKYWGSQQYLGLTSRFHDLYLGAKKAKIFFTRSNQETEYLSYACDIPREKIFQIPLSVRFQPLKEMPEKENFCLHFSRLRAENKNVKRLIEAAIKYNFQLKLGGILNGKDEEIWLHDLIDGHDNIEYIGLVSDEEMKDWYRRAKVFALPSLVEGVGMVALEAAGYGCEIVLTNIGAPKEYYEGRAELVNPHSVDSIGEGVVRCLNGQKNSQPELMRFIDQKYSIIAITKQIVGALEKI
ncbi:MAG: glycosyltransferase [Prevotella sp.]|nr:glycosyltransferase [Prevotella sp.]